MKYVACFLFCDILLFLSNLDSGDCGVKKWKYNTNIYDRSNWVGGKSSKDCHSFAFAKENTGAIFVDNIVTEELVLPMNGEIVLDEHAAIEFSKHSECIEIKQIDSHNWFDPNSWTFNGSDNTAIPDDFRLPCSFDDVILPEPTDVYYVTDGDTSDVSVKSLQYGIMKAQNQQMFDSFYIRFRGSLIQNPNGLSLPRASERECQDLTGCECQGPYFYAQCSVARKEECINPVDAYGFCSKICGAYITFEYDPGFKISKIEEIVSEYKNVDTYVSKFRTPYRTLIQVVVSEKQYLGYSPMYAKMITSKLQSDSSSLKIKNIELFQAGTSKASLEFTSSTVGVIFGTLAGVVAIFGLILYLYSDEERIIYLRNGIGFFGSRPFAGLKLPFSARYVKEEESGLIVDRHSIQTVVDEPTGSFENPMFGAGSSRTPAVGTTSPETVEDLKPPVEEKSHGEIENPLYEMDFKPEETADLLGFETTRPGEHENPLFGFTMENDST